MNTQTKMKERIHELDQAFFSPSVYDAKTATLTHQEGKEDALFERRVIMDEVEQAKCVFSVISFETIIMGSIGLLCLFFAFFRYQNPLGLKFFDNFTFITFCALSAACFYVTKLIYEGTHQTKEKRQKRIDALQSYLNGTATRQQTSYAEKIIQKRRLQLQKQNLKNERNTLENEIERSLEEL